jgi:hypothetical protein
MRKFKAGKVVYAKVPCGRSTAVAPERDGPRPPEEQRAEGNQRQAGSTCPSHLLEAGKMIIIQGTSDIKKAPVTFDP